MAIASQRCVHMQCVQRCGVHALTTILYMQNLRQLNSTTKGKQLLQAPQPVVVALLPLGVQLPVVVVGVEVAQLLLQQLPQQTNATMLQQLQQLLHQAQVQEVRNKHGATHAVPHCYKLATTVVSICGGETVSGYTSILSIKFA